MDPAPPPGGLNQIFRQYDAIKSHSTRDDGPPPWQPEEDAQQPTPLKAEPVAAPARDLRPRGEEVPQPTLTDAVGERPRGRPKSWAEPDRAQRAAQLLEENLQKSYKHIDQQNATIEQRMHESHANKLLNDRINIRQGVTFAQDEKGMDAAYGYRSFPGVAYDENTGTLYIAGSDSWESWLHDDPRIPLGKTSEATRYKQAERAYDELTTKYGKPVNRVVGHSLGGSVALELAKNKGIEYSRTFGAPVADANPFQRGAVERYRHPTDPVSIFDRGATWGPLEAYPHSYGGFKSFDAPTQQPIRGLGLDHMTIARRAREGYSYTNP